MPDKRVGLLMVWLIAICGIAAWAMTGYAQVQQVEVLVQTSLTAGLRHHEAKAVWDEMRAGDALTLVREPGNPHDMQAVRLDWNGHKLGYIPRAQNEAVARQMDRGSPLRARITKLTHYRNHRRKLEVEIFLPL